MMGNRKTGESDDSDPNQSLLIGDDLLIEILIRIPTTVAAIRCKLVCKGWCSLISSPIFISRFKKQHIKHESRYPKPLLGMISNTVGRINISEDSENDEFSFRGFNLDYLPGEIDVLASCNDLILCQESCNNYYMCNPFTMKWAALPPPPTKPSGYITIAFVCEPYNDGFRYRIVRYYGLVWIDGERDPEYYFEMYCSETSEWIQYDGRDKDYFGSESSFAAYNGKLYWVTIGGQYLIAYDPFCMTHTSMRLINGVNGDDDSWHTHRSHVGEFEGVLRVARFEPWQHGGPLMCQGMSLWEVQEDEVIFKEHIVFNQDMFSKLYPIGIAGFHRRNKDVMFLRMQHDIIASFNTKTREVKVETKFKDGYSYVYQYAFTLQLPWWPTPILSPSSSPTL